MPLTAPAAPRERLHSRQVIYEGYRRGDGLFDIEGHLYDVKDHDVTLLSGVLFVDNLFAQHLVHKTVLSIAAWIVFGVLLFGRWRWGWRGRRAVRLTLAGMVVLLFAFFGSKFVLELVLKRVA